MKGHHMLVQVQEWSSSLWVAATVVAVVWMGLI